MENYTKEPLIHSGMSAIAERETYKFKVFTTPVGFETKERVANARRMVAAWNACAGLETELLETLPLNFKAHALQCAELCEENAALRAAVKEMERMLPVVEKCEMLPGTWAVMKHGTDVDTANAYRQTLEKALAKINENK